MAASDAARALLMHPHGQALLRLLLLPSTFAHADRLQARWPQQVRAQFDAAPALAGLMHRHASAPWRAADAAVPAPSDLADPLLPLATLPPPRFGRLVLWTGIAVLAPAIRRVIERDAVARLRAQLGDDGLHFARFGTEPASAADGSTTDLADAAAACTDAGEAVCALAFQQAGSPLVRAAALRLSPRASARAGSLASWGIGHAGQATALALAVLDRLEPQWRSSFPVAA